MTTKTPRPTLVATNRSDPDFPTLPFISAAEFEAMTEAEKFARHVLEVAEAAKLFDARQAAGMSIFEAAEGLPVPRMNRGGYKS
jgi:hypothetical protein